MAEKANLSIPVEGGVSTLAFSPHEESSNILAVGGPSKKKNPALIHVNIEFAKADLPLHFWPHHIAFTYPTCFFPRICLSMS